MIRLSVTEHLGWRRPIQILCSYLAADGARQATALKHSQSRLLKRTGPRRSCAVRMASHLMASHFPAAGDDRMVILCVTYCFIFLVYPGDPRGN